MSTWCSVIFQCSYNITVVETSVKSVTNTVYVKYEVNRFFHFLPGQSGGMATVSIIKISEPPLSMLHVHASALSLMTMV